MPSNPKLTDVGFTQGEVEYFVESSGNRDQFVFGVDDLEEDVRKKLADYLSDISKKGHESGYGPSRGNNNKISVGSNEWTLKSDDGSPAPLDTQLKGSENPFAPVGDRESRGLLPGDRGTSSDSTRFTLSDFMRKGQSHDLLHDIIETRGGLRKHGANQIPDPPDDPKDVRHHISEVLKTNRFNPGDKTPFNPDGRVSERKNFSVSTEQSAFGEYDPTGDPVNFEEIRKVGLSLMLKSAGEVLSDTVDPEMLDAVGLIPGKAQLGGKVNKTDLEARNAFGAPSKPRLKSEDVLNSRDAGSYGSYNTFLEKFEGDPVTSRALLLILLNAAKTALLGPQSALSLIINPSMQLEKNKRAEDEGFLSSLGDLLGVDIPTLEDLNISSKYKLGRSSRRDVFKSKAFPLLEDMGIYVPRNSTSYNATVARGIDVMFASALTDVTTGFYITAIRNVIRDTRDLAEDLSNIKPSNPISLQDDVLNMAKQIADSKLFRSVNVFAQVGDMSFRASDILGRDVTKVGSRENLGNTLERGSAVDNLKDEAPTISGKSRDLLGSLVWRTGGTPSMFLLPKSENGSVSPLSVSRTVGEGDSLLAARKSRFAQKQNLEPRLRTATVEKIEKALDSEYVPFYFHDLRTNEIVSFHAFLDNLTDGFAVSHVNSDGYGRIDPVRIYQKTERTIGMSFFIASTNKDDFDEMWWKINKLTTLVYPSWSRGRRLEDEEGNKMIQPFSQIPTSSPVIRIRLGDVIKSNYSTKAIAKLFGVPEDFSTKDQAATQGENPAGTLTETQILQGEVNALADLKNPDKNAVIRSFKSTSGRGLAGVISSMNFNWIDGTVTWETSELGSRAPKFCKVDLQFMPIHDIAPGIDSHGFNRAPIYNAGKIANSLYDESEGFDSLADPDEFVDKESKTYKQFKRGVK